MAVNANSYASNAIQGQPGVAGDVNLFETSSNPKFALGYGFEAQDGRKFRYSHFGAAVTAGRVVSADASESSAALNALTIVAPASAAVTTDGNASQKFIEITEPSITQDQYEGGYLVMTAGTGRGYTYRVKGNSVTGLPDGPASGNLRLELWDNLQIGLTADSDVILTGIKWGNLEVATSTDTVVAGVAVATHVANRYGWVQTKGICGVLEEGTLVAGDIVTASDVTDGAVQQLAGYDASNDIQEAAAEPIVGYAIDPGANTTAEGTLASVNLTLE